MWRQSRIVGNFPLRWRIVKGVSPLVLQCRIRSKRTCPIFPLQLFRVVCLYTDASAFGSGGADILRTEAKQTSEICSCWLRRRKALQQFFVGREHFALREELLMTPTAFLPHTLQQFRILLDLIDRSRKILRSIEVQGSRAGNPARKRVVVGNDRIAGRE